ncbi:hypothetical protein J3R30DRAFT_2594449 [Lentinula aciculospora]|uniref:Uncharacterized protein n=1 Tax=Lentinula aciculospora TaxID=153920 RepID=A0A9W9ADE9_9AGAR|nr:hypothetical protein J3R30DRAFT_2594449 [Lentinula aciculospora]
MFRFFARKPLAGPAGKSSIEDSLADAPNNKQLRTPSPSVDSAIGKNIRNISPLRGAALDPPITPSPPPPETNVPDSILNQELDNELGLITDPSALHSLISSVPPKTLHEYLLGHLIPPTRNSAKPNTNFHQPSSLTLTHLTSFFSSLAPPPQLHCVRCHKFFYEVENVERSCLVPHDDESAEVERVGVGRGADTQYETLYNCCGKTVEGEGDMGPPDGWCYEGKHTTDTKRARFRADSTMHADKLVSCERLRCFEPIISDDASSGSQVSDPRPRKRKRSTRKGEEAKVEAAAEQDFNDVQMDDVDDDEDDARSITSTRSQSRLKKKLKSLPSSPFGSASAPATSTAKSNSSTSKPRKKRAKAKHDDKPFKPDPSLFNDDGGDTDIDVDDSTSISARRKTKRVSRDTKVVTTMAGTGKGKAKASDTRASPRSSPAHHNIVESASGDERRPKRRSQHSHIVSFAPITTTNSLTLDKGGSGSSSKAGLGSTKSSMSANKPRSMARPRAKKLEEVVASSVDGEM